MAEAQSEEGQIVGFERIDNLLEEPISAMQLATAAQEFGQEGNILVLRMVRLAVKQAVAA